MAFDAGTAPGSANTPAAEDGGAIAYAWDFGDGTTATTREGYVEHDFGCRDQHARQSSFVVTVNAVSALRGPAFGKKTISFSNVHYLNRERGIVAPLVLAGPVRQEDASLVMPVKVRNPEYEALHIARLTAGVLPCSVATGAVSTSGAREASFHEVSPATVLGTDSLPSGDVEFNVTFPLSLVPPDACQVFLWGSGKQSGGVELDFQISMMVMQPKSVLLNLNDPEQMRYFEKVRRAAELLKKTGGRITGDDIARLEQEGRL